MSSALKHFRHRLAEEWLRDFCAGREDKWYDPTRFVWDSVEALTEYDAEWFLAAVDQSVVTRNDHYFRPQASHVNLQIFWEGENSPNRRFSLWYDPILVIGAFARLHLTFGWPTPQFGSLASEYAMELAFDSTGHASIALEAKKSEKELNAVLDAMKHFADAPAASEPEPGPRRSAFRKVALIRKTWPALLWAIAPGGGGEVFSVDRRGGAGHFSLMPTPTSALSYEG
jgi:hypothetical protein